MYYMMIYYIVLYYIMLYHIILLCYKPASKQHIRRQTPRAASRREIPRGVPARMRLFARSFLPLLDARGLHGRARAPRLARASEDGAAALPAGGRLRLGVRHHPGKATGAHKATIPTAILLRSRHRSGERGARRGAVQRTAAP